MATPHRQSTSCACWIHSTFYSVIRARKDNIIGCIHACRRESEQTTHSYTNAGCFFSLSFHCVSRNSGERARKTYFVLLLFCPVKIFLLLFFSSAFSRSLDCSFRGIRKWGTRHNRVTGYALKPTNFGHFFHVVLTSINVVFKGRTFSESSLSEKISIAFTYGFIKQRGGNSIISTEREVFQIDLISILPSFSSFVQPTERAIERTNWRPQTRSWSTFFFFSIPSEVDFRERDSLSYSFQ